MNKLQLTLAILKPNVVKIPQNVQEIRRLILEDHFKIVRAKENSLSVPEAKKFYAEHKTKPFFGSLVQFMASGPSVFLILAKENAIRDWRELMGPTKIAEARLLAPHSIRSIYGDSETENAVHGSDSPESALREIRQIFPEFQMENWYAKEEPKFRAGEIQFDRNFVIHKVVPRAQTVY